MAGEGRQEMEYEGKLLSIEELVAQSLAAEDPVWEDLSLRNDIASNAALGARLLSNGDDVEMVWRLAVLQALDDYLSALTRGGVELARQAMTRRPAPTGSPEIDAAFASLTEFLAHRDGWEVPAWTAAVPGVDRWYPDVPDIYLADADKESPDEFRRRGIFITNTSLARA